MKLLDEFIAYLTGKPFPTKGYVVRDKIGVSLIWYDKTPKKAIKLAYRNGGLLYNRNGQRLEAKDAAAHFVVLPASYELAALIEKDGLGVKWEELYGIACTVEERREYLNH